MEGECPFVITSYFLIFVYSKNKISDCQCLMIDSIVLLEACIDRVDNDPASIKPTAALDWHMRRTILRHRTYVPNTAPIESGFS